MAVFNLGCRTSLVWLVPQLKSPPLIKDSGSSVQSCLVSTSRPQFRLYIIAAATSKLKISKFVSALVFGPIQLAAKLSQMSVFDWAFEADLQRVY